MARILYGVAGEGLGHAVRSRVVIERLLKHHDIKIVAAARAYQYLSSYFPVEEIDYFKIVYRNNAAANALTVLNNSARLPLILRRGWKIARIIKDFKPEVIITDFEPLVDYFAWWYGIPVISIDNQHIITNTSYGGIAKGFEVEEALTKAVIRSFIIKADMRFITTYYGAVAKGKNSLIIPPLLRKEILGLRPKKKNHILVYQTSASNALLLPALKGIRRIFIVYGFNVERKEGNVMFRKGNEKRFLRDLSSCSAVITNGGFTLISEALHLRKPILSIPVEWQFEQILNALYLEKLGYGMYAKKTEKEAVEKFLKKLPELRKNLKKYKRCTNEKALKEIEKSVTLLTKRPARSHARSWKPRRDGLPPR